MLKCKRGNERVYHEVLQDKEILESHAYLLLATTL